MHEIKFVVNEDLYKQAIEPVASAVSFVWIGTADIKDLHVHHKGGKAFAVIPSYNQMFTGFCQLIEDLNGHFNIL